MLRLHDTATGKVDDLVLREPGKASLYVCGPTVYDSPHLGHGRFTLVFDVVRRYLLFTGLDVTYVSNITDIDDKIIERAAERGIEPGVLAATYEEVWWAAMDGLGVMRPDHTPHATDFVERMVEVVGELVARGVAYETSDGVYLSVADVDGYGLLALQPLESLRSGARVEANDEKRSPLDFVLWKKAKPGEPTWESPWGPGRPGWHTECVVMSLDLLGEGFDLHGGGIDLAFPHHENERAQAVALGREFAQHWTHNGWVTTDGEKMSKSLGNFTSLDDLLERSDARSYRLLVLRAHYRSPIEVTPSTVQHAEESLARLDALARRFALTVPLATAAFVVHDDRSMDLHAESIDLFRQRMDNDLDTPGALAGIFEMVRAANAAADAGDDPLATSLAETVAWLCAAMGLSLHSEGNDVGGGSDLDPITAALVAERDRAREDRNWSKADELRDELAAQGWLVEDSAEGTRIRRP